MEVFIFFVLFVAGAILLYFTMFIMSLLDDISIFFFQKPLYIHLYFKLKKVSQQEETILRQKFPFYIKLSERHRRYFHHRLASFNEKYTFIPREDFLINKEVQTLVAGTYVMLTFGMRFYLINSFDKIIIYPEEYYSTHGEKYFKGEYNPLMKSVVFSWKDFLEGFETENDNLHLGIHEFSHVMHYNSLRSSDGSSLAFRKQYKKLFKEVNSSQTRQKLIESNYFRIYAYTNQYEFLSVIIEHYFETPSEFSLEFPELFTTVSLMLNHKPSLGIKRNSNIA